MIKLIKFIVRLGILTLLVIALLVMLSIEKNPEACEAMTRGFARFNNMVSSKISSIVPFSLTELSFLILGLVGILLLVITIILLVRKKFFGALYRLIEIGCITLIVVDIYHLSCEFAYHRDSIPLPYYQEKINREDHINIFNYFADDLNNCANQLEFDENGDVKTSMSLNDIAKEVQKAYEIIKGNNYYASHFGSVKPMVSSFLYREFQITGVTFAPLGEANINTLNLQFDIPFTVAHEIAHTKGVMREDDANQLACYVCLNSEHPYLRYSAYMRYFDQIEQMATRYYLEEDEMPLRRLDYQTHYYKSYNYAVAFWKKHNLLKSIGDFFNDLYIKSSGVKEGTASYNGGTTSVVDPETHELVSPSDYQKIFFEKYYRS